MNRIDRLQAIIIQIQSKKVVKASEIADRFNISLRTVYRDIRALEEAGVPIGSEAGIGYFLDDNYNLPPVMFTANEASSLIMAGKLMPHFSDMTVQSTFHDALLKIKAVLKSSDKEAIEKLENNIRVYQGMTEPPGPATIFIQEVQKALIDKLVIAINYYSHYNEKTTRRLVEPVSLIFYGMKWHLIAWCQLRQEYRDFRLDRIKSLTLTTEKFERVQSKAYEAYLFKEKQKYNQHEITLLVTKKLAHAIHESKYWYGHTLEKPKKNKVEMQFLNPDIDGFARWIIAMGHEVDIIAPQQLQSKVTAMAKALYKKHVIE